MQKRAVCYPLNVCLLLCKCLCSVSLPHCAVGWPLNIIVLQQQQNLGRRVGTSKMHFRLQWLKLLSVLRRGFRCCGLVNRKLPLLGACSCSIFCYTILYVHSSFAIILMGKREPRQDCCKALPRDAMDLSAVCDCGTHSLILIFDFGIF